MKTFISKVIFSVIPFFAALFFAFVFVRLLGFGFVQFSNWYLSIVVGVQVVVFLGLIGSGLLEGRLDSIFIGIVLFFSMSLLVLAGLSVFEFWYSVPRTPHEFSVVANYQHEMTRLIGEGVKLGYNPQFKKDLQRDLIEAAVNGLMNLILYLFMPPFGGKSTSS